MRRAGGGRSRGMTTPLEVPGSGLARKCQALICPEVPGSGLAQKRLALIMPGSARLWSCPSSHYSSTRQHQGPKCVPFWCPACISEHVFVCVCDGTRACNGTHVCALTHGCWERICLVWGGELCTSLRSQDKLAEGTLDKLGSSLVQLKVNLRSGKVFSASVTTVSYL